MFYRRLPEKIGRVEREGGDQLKNAPLKAIIGLYSFRVNCQDPFKGRWAVLFSLGFHSHSRDPRSLSIRFNLQSQRILILTQPSPYEILQIFLEKVYMYSDARYGCKPGKQRINGVQTMSRGYSYLAAEHSD